MRARAFMVCLLVAGLCDACASAQEVRRMPQATGDVVATMDVPMPPAVADPAMSLPGTPPQLPPPLPPQAADAEAGRLRAALLREVPHAGMPSADRRRRIVALAKERIAKAGFLIDRPQLLVVVDRNPRRQELALVVARPEGDWSVLGGTHVSTGQSGRKFYYITPVGVFPHGIGIMDYRAEGTFNENHIRGLGLKGMRVWDFGWQTARKGWLDSGETGDIRLEMHATDPQFLEQRIGRPASEGCVRIPAALNRFLDRHGVLDAEYEQAAAEEVRYRALLPSDREPTPLAGHALVVVDSGGDAP